MSSVDKRYDRYADAFDNPETAESVELGNRVLHHQFMESWNPREVVSNRARRAQKTPEGGGQAGRGRRGRR